MVQAGEQFAFGEVSGGAEENENLRRDLFVVQGHLIQGRRPVGYQAVQSGAGGARTRDLRIMSPFLALARPGGAVNLRTSRRGHLEFTLVS